MVWYGNKHEWYKLGHRSYQPFIVHQSSVQVSKLGYSSHSLSVPAGVMPHNIRERTKIKATILILLA